MVRANLEELGIDQKPRCVGKGIGDGREVTPLVGSFPTINLLRYILVIHPRGHSICRGTAKAKSKNESKGIKNWDDQSDQCILFTLGAE